MLFLALIVLGLSAGLIGSLLANEARRVALLAIVLSWLEP